MVASMFGCTQRGEGKVERAGEVGGYTLRTLSTSGTISQPCEIGLTNRGKRNDWTGPPSSPSLAPGKPQSRSFVPRGVRALSTTAMYQEPLL